VFHKLHQKGFSAVELLLVVVIVCALGAAGLFVASKQAAKTGTSKQAQASASNLTQAYTDELGGFTIKYPSDWTKNATKNDTDPDHPLTRTTFTSLGGSVLHVGADFGGPAGHCQPAKGDKPFKPGISCDSFEYLSSERMSVSNAYAKHTTIQDGAKKTTLDKTDVRLITAHYGSPAGVETYLIGVTDISPGYQLKIKNPQMGVFAPFTYFTVYNKTGKFCPYVYIYAIGDSENFLTSDDATTIKDMIRSVTVNAKNIHCQTEPTSI
jgi:prepilin-type N-terminal cleavage/methylation domain-containing protein